MTMRKFFTILLSLALVLCFAACQKRAPAETTAAPTTAAPTTTAPTPTEPPLTAESVYAQFVAAVETSPMTEMEIEAEMTLSMNMPNVGMSIDMSMGIIGTITISPEDGRSYAEKSYCVSAFGERETEDTLKYTLVEDGTEYVYSYSNTTKQWTREKTGSSMEQIRNGSIAPASLTLEADTQMLNRHQVYVLQATFSGTELDGILGDVSALLDDLEIDTEDITVDTSCITVSATYYLDTTTYLPTQIDISISGYGEAISEVMTAYIDGMLEEMKDDLGSDYDSVAQVYKNMTVDIPSCTESYLEISYEPTTVPELPEEARTAAALQEYEPLQADGSYVLKEIGGTATILPPEDWEPMVVLYNHLSMIAPDEWDEIYIYLLSDTDADDLATYMEETVASYKEYDLFQSYQEGKIVDGWQTSHMVCDSETNNYYAWKQIGDDLWILVEYNDYHGASMSKTLLPLLEGITLTAD